MRKSRTIVVDFIRRPK